MNEAEAVEAMAYLESEYDRQYNAAQRSQIIEVLKQYSGKCAGAAINALFDDNNYLPRASEFKNKVREFGAKEFERRVDREKRDIATGTGEAFSGDTDGVRYFTIIAEMFSDPERRFTREKILEAYRQAAIKTGCKEWNLAGARMLSWYERNGMLLDQAPAGNLCI